MGGSPFLLTGDVHFGIVELINGWFDDRKAIDSDRKKLTGLEGQLPELAQYSRDGILGVTRALMDAKKFQESMAILQGEGLISKESVDIAYRESMGGVRDIRQLVEARIDINRRNAANLQAPITIALMVAPLPFKGGIGRGIFGVTEGKGLIGFVKPGGKIEPGLQSAYANIASSSNFSASLARYNSFARTFRLTETAGIDEIQATLAKNVIFARTPNIQAGLFTTKNGFYLQGNPLTAYGARAGQHELVHLGAALRGQGDTFLHEIGVQWATTPENLLIGGTILGGGFGAGIYYGTQ